VSKPWLFYLNDIVFSFIEVDSYRYLLITTNLKNKDPHIMRYFHFFLYVILCICVKCAFLAYSPIFNIN